VNLPLIIKQLTGTFTLTGLYSFEFVDKSRNTISEIFFMIPPKKKEMSEVTRSSTNPTLSSNYNTDAGNGTKQMNLSGELYFPYVGSPDNPVATDPSNLNNKIDGMTEFFKLRWMLMRYRDYTMTEDAKVNIPISVINASPDTSTLYDSVSKLVNDKTGALYDEVQLIVHDYDMDDHFYCRVISFSGSQTDAKYLAVEYNISLECYEADDRQTAQKVEIKKSLNESIDYTNTMLQNTGFLTTFGNIQVQVSSNTDLYRYTLDAQKLLESINTENTNIQSGRSVAYDKIPIYLTKLINDTFFIQRSVLNIFLTNSQRVAYEAGNFTIDEVLDISLFSFYNSLNKIRAYAQGFMGVLGSTIKGNEIRYYENADDYTLTTDQFDEDGASKVLNESSFKYYTVKEGDSARIISMRELKDPEKYISILKMNSITESDFIDGNLIGKKIKIPLINSSYARSGNNLIFESDDTDINVFLHGKDIALDDNKKMMISPSGDILTKEGIPVTFDSLMNRIDTAKGTLNVFSPNWGITNIGDGNTPLMVRIDRYLTDLVNQIQSEPRVQSIKMDMSSLQLEGEVLRLKGSVNFIGGNETREVEI